VIAWRAVTAGKLGSLLAIAGLVLVASAAGRPPARAHNGCAVLYAISGPASPGGALLGGRDPRPTDPCERQAQLLGVVPSSCATPRPPRRTPLPIVGAARRDRALSACHISSGPPPFLS
jgi:hypothetical protein